MEAEWIQDEQVPNERGDRRVIIIRCNNEFRLLVERLKRVINEFKGMSWNRRLIKDKTRQFLVRFIRG